MQIRADIDCPVKMYNKMVSSQTHRFFFHCLKAHRRAFESLLPNGINVMAIEDELDCGVGSHGEIESDELAVIRGRIDKIITLAKKKLPNDKSYIRKIVNAKNVLGFYCIWHYGGYHMDTGILPGQQPVFSEPECFAAPCLGHTNKSPVFNQPSRHGRLGHTSIILDEMNISNMVFPTRVHATSVEHIPLVDVWLLRSQQGGGAAKVALAWYLDTLDAIHRNGEITGNVALYKSACRMAVTSAACTGICQGRGGRGLKNPRERERHLLKTREGTFNILPDPGVRKIGFQSHR
jgi:hypothetical protein